jgi:hypothetical protein
MFGSAADSVRVPVIFGAAMDSVGAPVMFGGATDSVEVLAKDIWWCNGLAAWVSAGTGSARMGPLTPAASLKGGQEPHAVAAPLFSPGYRRSGISGGATDSVRLLVIFGAAMESVCVSTGIGSARMGARRFARRGDGPHAVGAPLVGPACRVRRICGRAMILPLRAARAWRAPKGKAPLEV